MLRFDRVTTPRLVLRRWQPGDLDSFAALNSDPEVMRHFPSTYDRSATAAMITAWEAKIDRQGSPRRLCVAMQHIIDGN
jgi:RimJ/RimL family protein N-acetyltransferase